MFKVYVIQSAEGYNYTGFSENFDRRLKEHNSGTQRYTRKGTCWTLIYSEDVPTRAEARKREKYLKSHAGKEWLKRRGIF